jgi:peroxiredoxin
MIRHTHITATLLALAAASVGCRSGADDAASPAPAHRTETASAGPSKPAPVAKPVDSPGPAKAADTKPAAPRDSSASTTEVKVKAKVGEAAPSFALKDLDGKEHTLAQYKGKTVVLEWFSPGCPACKYAYGEGPLKTMPEKYMKDGIVWLPVNSEAADNKAAGAEMNRAFIEKYAMKTPVLMDPTGVVGRTYGAKTTPHMFVIDPKGVLAYQGALDNAPGGKVAEDGAMIDYVGDAVADIKAGRAVKTTETKSYG